MTKPLAERLRGADLHEPHCGSCADEPWPCDCNAPSLIAEIRAALENGAGWVSVEERTPDAQYDVLVTDGKFIGIGDCCKGHLWNSGQIELVTHWMPLPASPEAAPSADCDHWGRPL